MIQKVYEVDPMICPRCGGAMCIIALLTGHVVLDRIIEHLKLPFIAERPASPQVAFKKLLAAWSVHGPS